MREFSNSTSFLKKVLEIIPVASQTFSKSYLQYPKDLSPLFIEKGEGARVWDIDGNSFIDLVSGLMSNLLGYNDKDIQDALMAQLQKGINFSLPTPLEYELAYLLTQIIPCAEMVRFGKTGTDVTSAAVRLSRAYTRRDKILACGYHGWQDWYIGSTTRNLGVPKSIAQLTERIPYNDSQKLEDYLKKEEYAALIMEPVTFYKPVPDYLENVRRLTEKYGTLLIFDEIVTGFHFALGGAQEYFKVIPDLACFGKSLGNGMPISAIVGQAKIMKLMDDIFFSGTFGGEALSLAAGIAVIKKLQREPVIAHLWWMGAQLGEKVQSFLEHFDLTETISLEGYDPWKAFTFRPFKSISGEAIRTFFQKEMIKNGILVLTSHNISYALKQEEVEEILKAYENVFGGLKEALENNTLLENLECPIIQPIFKVRG